jgi:beta-glucosidase
MPRASALSLHECVSLLSGADFWHTQDLPAAGVAAVMLSDGPHGLRVQPGAADHAGLAGSLPATCFPTAVTLASSWDEALLVEVGRAIGTEALALGVDVVLGPGMNLKRHPRCGRNFEYLSEDPLLTGRLAAALVDGIQSRGVGACPKHYAANNREGHRLVVDTVVDERTLRELYLAAFEHVVTESRPWTVMAAYNLLNGEPCTQHRWLLEDVLRGEWGFGGLVMSDWGATVDRVEAVRVGMDLEMPSSAGLFDAEVLDAVHRGGLEAEAVRTCAQRVLDLAARAPRHPADGALPVDEHDALARRAAAEGAVLLANDGLLPLDPGTTVAVIGAFAAHPRYQGSGSSQVAPTRLATALDAFRDRGAAPTYAAGYDPLRSEPDQALIDEAVAAARAADVAVVMVGLPASYESEGFDRDHLRLPPQHDTLVWAVCAANRRTVVVLSNGAPVLLPWRDAPAAILEAYLGGQAGGGALVDVLYGDREPGGRLAETFPAASAQVAADPWFPGHPHQVEYREGLFVGYRHAVTADVTPAFAFGHGLGYTTFGWDAPAVSARRLQAGERVTVTVEVTNTGTRPGADVVQVYRHDRTGVVLRPRRELAGFAKVRLGPGEATTVRIDVAPRAFAFYDVEQRGWRTPQGPYTLEIARSSADVVHTVDVEVTDGVDTAPEPASVTPLAESDAAFTRRLGRPVPTPRPVRPFTRESTLGEVQDTLIGRLLKAAARRAAPVPQGDDEATRRMIERARSEAPLRAMAQFSRGRITLWILDVLVDLLNRRPLAAVRRIGGQVAPVLGRRRRQA